MSRNWMKKYGYSNTCQIMKEAQVKTKLAKRFRYWPGEMQCV